MTCVKQGLGPWEVLIIGEERERWGDGSQQCKGPWGHLAPVADVKNTLLTHPKPQPQQKTPGSGSGGGVPSLCLPPGILGPLSLWGWKRGKMQSHKDRSCSSQQGSGRGSRRGPGGEPGLDTFQLEQAQLLLTPENAMVHQNTTLACFHLVPTHAQQYPQGHCPCPASQPIQGPHP